MDPAARDAYDDTLRQAIDAGDSLPPDAKLAGAVAAYRKIESLFALLREPAEAEPPPDVPPERLGRYLVRETLGRGAFGTVYLADDPELGRQVAIKLPRAGAFATPGDADAFLAEARLTARLNHPGIVAVYDAGREGDRAFIVIEYVAGQTLDELARAERPAVRQVAQWLAAVADALAYAHQQGFVHRDLKPSNAKKAATKPCAWRRRCHRLARWSLTLVNEALCLAKKMPPACPVESHAGESRNAATLVRANRFCRPPAEAGGRQKRRTREHRRL